MSYGEATLTTEPLSSTTIKYCLNKQPLNKLNNLSQITTQDSMLDQSRSSDIEQSRNDSTTNDLIIFNRSLSISNDQSIYLFNTTCFNSTADILTDFGANFKVAGIFIIHDPI